MPIALRKGTRSYTEYPMYSFLSYSNLSFKFKVFTASLDTATIPKNIHMGVEIPEWKTTVMEEMGALKRIICGIFVLFLKGIQQLGAIGCSL